MKGKQAEGRGIFVERFLIQLEKQDLTMREVGLLAGMHPATVRHYTSKKGDEPRMQSLVAIARALNVSTDYLCGLTDDDGQSGHRATDNIRALLKAQEPVEPILDIDEWKCGSCGHALEHQELLGDNVLFHEQYNYCPECGRMVKRG